MRRSSIADTVVIYPNVFIGRNAVIEDFCIIGCKPVGWSDEPLDTIIGENTIIRSHTVIYAGNAIGDNFHTGNKANIRECNQIGDYVSIGTLSVIEHHVKIGDHVQIHSQAFIPEYSILEDHCWIGPNVVLTNAKYPGSFNAKNELAGVTIKRSARIGANSTLLPDTIIGENAVVGAGAVVVHSVPPKQVVVGNPAQSVRTIDDIKRYTISDK